jgi:hypothetical protein
MCGSSERPEDWAETIGSKFLFAENQAPPKGRKRKKADKKG